MPRILLASASKKKLQAPFPKGIILQASVSKKISKPMVHDQCTCTKQWTCSMCSNFGFRGKACYKTPGCPFPTASFWLACPGNRETLAALLHDFVKTRISDYDVRRAGDDSFPCTAPPRMSLFADTVPGVRDQHACQGIEETVLHS